MKRTREITLEANRRIHTGEATYSCPVIGCGSKELYVEARVMALLGERDKCGRYFPAPTSSSLGWEQDDYMVCNACEFEGEVVEFIEEMRK